MLYKCRTEPLSKLMVAPTRGKLFLCKDCKEKGKEPLCADCKAKAITNGVRMPLCNDCKSKDCDNPIERISVSILGKEEKMRVWNSRSLTSMVVQCEGYNP